MDFAILIDALETAETGQPTRLLSRGEALGFLDEAIHFRRTVSYAALRLTGELARHLQGDVRARAARALASWVDSEPAAVERLLFELVGDPDDEVRAAVAETLGALLAATVEKSLVAERWRKHSREARAALREARRLLPG